MVMLSTLRLAALCRRVPISCSRIYTPSLQLRAFSSLPAQADPIVIYERKPNRSTWMMASMGLGTFNTVYWVWYIADFIPAINASETMDFHLDYTYGFFGLLIAVVCQGIVTTYPAYLISKIEYEPASSANTTQLVKVNFHDTPLMSPSSTSYSYAIGEIHLDPASADATKLIAQGGNISGTIFLSNSQTTLPALVDVQEGELKDPAFFTQMLVNPQDLVYIPGGLRRDNLDKNQGNSKRKTQVVRKKLRYIPRGQAT